MFDLPQHQKHWSIVHSECSYPFLFPSTSTETSTFLRHFMALKVLQLAAGIASRGWLQDRFKWIWDVGRCWNILCFYMFLCFIRNNSVTLIGAFTTLRQVGDHMWETTGSCGRQVENHQQAIGIPHPESAGRKHLGNLIWKTSGDICETTGRRGSKVPGTLPVHGERGGSRNTALCS